MPGFKVSNGSTYVDPKGISVSNGSTYAAAKGVYVSQGNGTWTPVWPLLSTVALSGPAYAMSTSSGSNSTVQSWNTIVSPTFTITLSNPSAVSRVSFQLSHEGGGWVEYNAWASGITATLTYTMGFYSTGSWRAQAVITHTSGSQVISNIHNLSCVAFNIATGADTLTPQVGVQTNVWAAMNVSAPAGFPNTPEGWYISRNGAAYQRPTDWGWSNTANPLYWTPGDTATFRWVWVEAFPDGSRIHSALVDQAPYVPVPTHYHEVVPSGSDGAAIQAAMDRAYNWFVTYKGGSVNFDDENSTACVELQAGGSYNIGTYVLHYRRGVRLYSAGSGGSRALIYAAGSHFMNCDNNGGGNYWSPHYDFQIYGLRIDCQNISGGITTTHTGRFRISNCHFYNLGPVKHYIELNSSGGYAGADWNCQVLSCEFGPSNNIAGRRAEDECIQLDYSWPTAAPAVASDGTMTNNVLIQGCWFHDVPRAVGSHHYQNEAGNAYPKGIHTNILIDSNTFDRVDPSPYASVNGPTSEGAVRFYVWSNARCTNNTFNSCFQPINLYVPQDAYAGNGDPTYAYIANNTLNNCSFGRYGIYGNCDDQSALRLNQVLIESNNVRGSWSTTADIYFVGCDDTRGALGGVSEGLYIRTNSFAPSNMTVAQQKAYNKYRAINSTNLTGGVITGNTVGDGTVDNS